MNVSGALNWENENTRSRFGVGIYCRKVGLKCRKSSQAGGVLFLHLLRIGIGAL